VAQGTGEPVSQSWKNQSDSYLPEATRCKGGGGGTGPMGPRQRSPGIERGERPARLIDQRLAVALALVV